MKKLTTSQLEVLALRALIRLEQVRGRPKFEHCCITGAATLLASMAAKSKEGLSIPQTRDAIVAKCRQLEHLAWLTSDTLDTVVKEFENAPGKGQLIKPLVATTSFKALLKAVRQAQASNRQTRHRGTRIPQPQTIQLVIF